MDDVFDISVGKDKRAEMVKLASQKIKDALLTVIPPFNHKKDVLRLGQYNRDGEGVTLRYEIMRDARLSDSDKKGLRAGRTVS
jgi:hypothetical protein